MYKPPEGLLPQDAEHMEEAEKLRSKLFEDSERAAGRKEEGATNCLRMSDRLRMDE
jgi:hypothetical protein